MTLDETDHRAQGNVCQGHAQATRKRVRRVLNVVAAPGCDARMHVTNMLATTRAMRALCVSIHRRPLVARTVISRPTHGNANGCVRINTRSHEAKVDRNGHGSTRMRDFLVHGDVRSVDSSWWCGPRLCLRITHTSHTSRAYWTVPGSTVRSDRGNS
jgi:hypothetical protein